MIARLLTPLTFWLALGILALVEAIYLAEEFNTLLSFIVSRGGTPLETLTISVLRSPNVIDFALPIAIMVSLYFAILSARENNELMAAAAAGVSWRRIVGFAFVVGLVGTAISLTFATTITPAAKHAYRLTTSAIHARAVAREVTETRRTDAIRSFEGRTFISTPTIDAGAVRGHLFIFQPDDGFGWRASQAKDWEVEGPREDGTFAVKLKSYRDYLGRTEAQKAAIDVNPDLGQAALQRADWKVSDVNLVFRLENLLDPINRARRQDEALLVPVVLGALASGVSIEAHAAELGRILGRAIGCVFAALTAVAAATWAGVGIGRLIALPLGIVAIMVADIAGRTLLAEAAAQSTTQFLVVTLGVIHGAVLVPLLAVLWRREAIIVPRRGQD